MYKGFREAFAEYQINADKTQNAALLFERFCDWQTIYKKAKKDEDSPKLAWLRKFEGKVGDADLLEKTYQEREICAQHINAKLLHFKTEWRFVTGTGNAHPVENGLSWHPTLSVPYLAAEGVKGIASAFAQHWEGWDTVDIERIFGSAKGIGSIKFFDMLPHKPVHLMVDVMTPHYGDWYANGGQISDAAEYQKIPAPWHNPVPIHFLVIDEAYVSIMLHKRKPEVSDDDLARVEKLLETALSIAGAGAKTGTGYGRFIVDTSRADQREAQAREREKLAAIAAENARKAEAKQLLEAENARKAEAKQLLEAMPMQQKIENLMQNCRGKNDKELASFFINKKFDKELESLGIPKDAFKAAMWNDLTLLAKIRSWNAKAGDLGKAYISLSPPKKS